MKSRLGRVDENHRDRCFGEARVKGVSLLRESAVSVLLCSRLAASFLRIWGVKECGGKFVFGIRLFVACIVFCL